MTDLAALIADEGPAFAAPWEATAFALRAHLVERGLLDARRFADALGDELRNNPAAQDDGTAYFVAFVAALERTLDPIASDTALAAERDRWRAAAAATPHGQPIELTA